MNLNFEVITSPIDIRDYRICAENDLPAEYTCPNLTKIKNQGSKPTCAAHAVASLVEYHHQRQTNDYEAMSTEFIYGYREPTYHQGDGMVIRNALNTIRQLGDPYERDCPGNHDVAEAKKRVQADLDNLKQLAYPHRVSTYYRCYNEKDIKTALMKHGPVITSMNTYDGAKLVNDVYTWDPKANYGRHCVLIVGWDERGWLIQNSWGNSYGGDGRFIIPYNYKLNESWGITDTIVDDTDIKKPNSFIKFIAEIYNKIVNAFMALFGKK